MTWNLSYAGVHGSHEVVFFNRQQLVEYIEKILTNYKKENYISAIFIDNARVYDLSVLPETATIQFVGCPFNEYDLFDLTMYPIFACKYNEVTAKLELLDVEIDEDSSSSESFSVSRDVRQKRIVRWE